jgi:hypothetical protein
MHFYVRGPQGIFPTHDPDGFPLPEYRGMWQRPFCCLHIGAFILIVGSILLSQVKHVDDTVATWNSATNTTVWAPPFGGSSSSSKRMPFVGVVIAGSLIVASSILAALACKFSGERNFRKWELENPEAASALAARGGYDAIPLLSFEAARQQNTPNQQPTAVVQVRVMQQPGAQQMQAPNLPPTTHLHQPPQLYNGAPVLQNGNLFYPQPGRPGQPMAPTVVTTTTTMVAAGTPYYYKPDFRGQRLTFEQMFGVRPGPGMQPQSTLVPVQAQEPKPAVIYGSERMQQQYGAAIPSAAAVASPPAPGTVVVPGFGLPV